MCGIAGVVAFQKDLTRETAVMRAMSATLLQRGPDSEGTWVSPHAALLFRRLAVIDLAGGSQPMLANEGDQLAAVLDYTGEIFNFQELREELSSLGHPFRTRSDTEVVLRAYMQWGVACVERLLGMFAFAVWDVRREELVLIRDRFGIYPLYYLPTPDGVIFGSEPKSILAHPDVETRLDLEGMREMLAFAPTPGASVFKGLREVRPGHIIRVGRAGLTERCYWKLEAREHRDDLETTIRTVRSLLEDAVTRQIVSDVPLCALLSGGLDSSAIAALAADIMRRQGRRERLRTFSVEYAGQTERFRPDEMHGTPDAPFVAEMVRHLGTEHTEVVVSTEDLVAPDARTAVIRALDQPAAGGDMYTSLYQLSGAIRKHSTVALTGDASDELFGGYLWFHNDWYLQARTFPWLLASHQLEMMTGLLDRDLVRRLDVPGYQAARYREALTEVPHLSGDSPEERRIREFTYLSMTRYLRFILDRKDRISMAVALEGRVPFSDHRLVEYVFNVPWAMRRFDGREKSLLRAAVKDLLPESVLQRVKSPFPTTQDPSYRRALRDGLARLMEDPSAPIRPLLDLERVNAVLKGKASGIDIGITRPSIDLALQLNTWLEIYRPRLDL